MKLGQRLAGVAIFLAVAAEALAQSTNYWDPAGPPGSTAAVMPTLWQIEPRRPIEVLPFTITNSGPYILTRNLTGLNGQNGITVATNSVTIDMNGFTLKGVAGSLHGITVSGTRTFVNIRNGVITGWGGNGVNGYSANHSKLEDLLVSLNGGYGATMGSNALVSRCTAADNGQNGFTVRGDSSLLDSTARGNDGYGIEASSGTILQRCVADQNSFYGFKVDGVSQISFCTASANGTRGYELSHCCSVVDSVAYLNGAAGFSGWDGIVFSRCVAYSNRFGFYAAMNCSVSDCSAYSNTWQGIYGDRGCAIENSSAYANYDGVGARASVIRGCSGYGNRGNGFWLGPATLLQDSSAVDNLTNGVAAQYGCTIRGNMIENNGEYGITASERCRIEDNHILSSGTAGIRLTGSKNTLAGNTLVLNVADYDIAAGNSLDLILGRLPFTVAWPATVRVASDLTGIASYDGLTIAASGVTVDLQGYTLSGVASSLEGIKLGTGVQDVTIRNGTLMNWDRNGVNAGDATATLMENLHSHSNFYAGILGGDASLIRNCTLVGNASDGIYTKDGSRVTDCIAQGNGRYGIYGTVGCVISGSTADTNVSNGIWASYGGVVEKCTATRNGGIGLVLGAGGRITQCVAAQNAGDGISVSYGGAVESCTVHQNGDDGIYVYQGCRVESCTVDANGQVTGTGYGIYPASTDNTIMRNTVTRNNWGIREVTGGDLIIGNHASGNGTNYVLASSSAYGPLLSGTGVITNTNPHANFDL